MDNNNSNNKRGAEGETEEEEEHGSHELYVELESANANEWGQISGILETLNSIDIHPRQEFEQSGKQTIGKIEREVLLVQDFSSVFVVNERYAEPRMDLNMI